MLLRAFEHAYTHTPVQTDVVPSRPARRPRALGARLPPDGGDDLARGDRAGPARREARALQDAGARRIPTTVPSGLPKLIPVPELRRVGVHAARHGPLHDARRAHAHRRARGLPDHPGPRHGPALLHLRTPPPLPLLTARR